MSDIHWTVIYSDTVITAHCMLLTRIVPLAPKSIPTHLACASTLEFFLAIWWTLQP